MADRRMLTKELILFGAFQELSDQAKLLYLYLHMQADDDGFVGNPKMLQCLVKNGKRCLQELGEKGMILQFPGTVVALTHWLVNNQIRADRYKPTVYQAELAQLWHKKGEPYRFLKPRERLRSDDQTVTAPATQDSSGQDSLGKVSSVEERTEDDEAARKQPAEPVTAGQVGQPDGPSDTEFCELVFHAYQQHCTRLLRCELLTDTLREGLLGLRGKGLTLALIENAFQRANTLPFLYGEGKRGWIAGLEWLCTDDHLVEVLNGKFESWRKKEKPPQGCSGTLGDAELQAIQKLLQEA